MPRLLQGTILPQDGKLKIEFVLQGFGWGNLSCGI